MQNYLPYSNIKITRPEGRQSLLDFCNKYNIKSISSFNLYNHYFSSIRNKDEELINLLNPNVNKLREKNIAHTYIEGFVKNYNLLNILDLNLDIPLNEVLFNDNVFAFHSKTNAKAYSKALDIDKYLEYKLKNQDKVEVKNKETKDFENYRAYPTVSFPKYFPIFNLEQPTIEKKSKNLLDCLRNKEEPSNYETFVLYDAGIIFIYNTVMNNIINQVDKRNKYNDIPIEKLSNYLKLLDLNDAYMNDLLIQGHSENSQRYATENINQNAIKRANILDFLDINSKTGTLGNLAHKAFNKKFNDNKYSLEYMNQYGYFVMILRIGVESFITLKLDPK